MSGERIQPQPIAQWNPARDVWETDQLSICGHSDVFSETFPTSGMTAAGTAFALPTSALRTDVSASSSLLPTPSVADAMGGHERRGGARGDELLLTGVLKALSSPPPEAVTETRG